MAISGVNFGTLSYLYKLQNNSTLLNSLSSTSSSSSTGSSTSTSDFLSSWINNAVLETTISELGSKVSSAYLQAQANGSATMDNFQSTMLSALLNPDPLQTINFINTMAELAQSNFSTFNGILSTNSGIYSTVSQGATTTYDNLVNSLYDNYGTEAVDQLNASIATIAQSDYKNSNVSVLDNYADLFNTYNGIVRSAAGQEEAMGMMKDLNKGLHQQTTASAINEFIASFKTENELS